MEPSVPLGALGVNTNSATETKLVKKSSKVHGIIVTIGRQMKKKPTLEKTLTALKSGVTSHLESLCHTRWQGK